MKLRPLLPALLVFLGSCYELPVFHGVFIRQYASEVIEYSSQWDLEGGGRWYAHQALGRENVYNESEDDFGYGDNFRAWSPLTADGEREFIMLGYDTAQTVIKIEIYETWYPGAVDTVYLRNAGTGKWKRIYSRPAETDLPEKARIKSINLVETTELFDAIRIALNSPVVPGWNEIDAVAITGQRKD